MNEVQDKMLKDIVALVAETGLEALQIASYANDGVLSIQKPKAVGELTRIGYHFGGNYYSGRILVGEVERFSFTNKYHDVENYQLLKDKIKEVITPLSQQP